ncbi:MAG: hypothetical protein BGO41_08340 [Clostridiales bacterium 38-18]|nr:MAG: hypothetical protein BGO41_08340 [Clostridiales bacterium 38-18]
MENQVSVMTSKIRKENWIKIIEERNRNGIASGLFLPKKEIFDIDYAFEMTRQQTKEVKANPLRYKFLPKNQFFDFLPLDSKETYLFKFSCEKGGIYPSRNICSAYDV